LDPREPNTLLPRGHGETVLFVEDEPAVREGCTLLLEQLGYRVLSAGTGEEALKLHTRHQKQIDLVVVDMVMPGMGGAEVCRVLHERGNTAPVVVLSGYPPETDAQGAGIKGRVGWLQKPLEVEQLAQAVRKALRNRRASES
jgi:CheY-like chemotaxis protein